MIRRPGEVAERSKALDWNSSNIFTGVRGFESHPLRHVQLYAQTGLLCAGKGHALCRRARQSRQVGCGNGRRPFPPMNVVVRIGSSATTSRESRQGRKAAAAAAMSGAGG
jgi:hypothetical protein